MSTDLETFLNRFAPDCLTPAQWGEMHKRSERSGEYKIHAAALDNFLREYQHPPITKTNLNYDHMVAVFRYEERQWVESDFEGPFSVVAIAGYMGMSDEYLRRCLREYMEKVDEGDKVKIGRRAAVLQTSGPIRLPEPRPR